MKKEPKDKKKKDEYERLRIRNQIIMIASLALMAIFLLMGKD